MATMFTLAGLLYPFYHHILLSMTVTRFALSPIVYALPLLFCLGFADVHAGNAVSGMPTIIDGDSLEVSGERFQLHGIDAPEPGDFCEKANGRRLDCGVIARSALLDLTAGLEVVCQPVQSASGTAGAADCTADGFSLNRNMIHTGWALVDRTVTDDFIEVEAEAKQKKRGLWRFSFEPEAWAESR